MSTDAPDPRATTIPRPRAPQARHPGRAQRPPAPLGPPNYRAIAEMEGHIARQDAYILHLERRLAALNLENATQHARIARLTRQPPPWHSVALAWLLCRLEALDRWIKAWWLD